jgi:cytochrome bd-type quinol oxidase subunit 2
MADSQIQIAKDKLENGAMCVVAALLLLFAILIPMDITDFYNEKAEYAWVHHLDTNQPNWEWQYIQSSVYLGILVVIGATILILRWMKRDNRIIKTLNLSFLIFFFGIIIIGFFKWMNTGFDH